MPSLIKIMFTLIMFTLFGMCQKEANGKALG